MEKCQLANQHVRIAWKDTNPKLSNQVGDTIFRGQVIQQDEQGLWLKGRFFSEKADTQHIREIPREKDGESKLYYGPWSSIDVIQVITEGTKDFETHQVVMTRVVDNPAAGR